MQIPEPMHTISAAIDAAHEQAQELPRAYLGASVVGHSCERYLWLYFRWAFADKKQGRILRLFRRGQREEALVIEDLRKIGVEVTGTGSNQIAVDLGAHLGGHLDGIILSGVPGAEKTKHVLEIKTHSKKSFDELEKKGVQGAKPEHYTQMQLYMKGTNIDRGLYFAVCKDDDRIYTERVKYDFEHATKALERSNRAVFSDTMPAPLSTDPTWYECKWCPAFAMCHQKKTTSQINCRTCAHSTPKEDGSYHCAKYDSAIPLDVQRTGCQAHVLHPDMTPWKLRQDLSDDFVAAYEIDGKIYKNGEGNISSEQLVKDYATLANVVEVFEAKIL